MAVVDLTLDVSKPQDRIEAVNGRQGDTGTTIRATITNNGEPYDFTGCYLEFAMVRPKSPSGVNWIHLKEGVTQEGSTNVWTVTLPEEATAYDGMAKLCYFVVRSTADESYRDSTQRFIVKLDASATAEAEVGPYSDQVDKLLRECILLTDQWEAQMEQQQEDYEEAEATRNSSYQTAEENRDSQYSTAEAARENEFETAESNRQSTFTTNEAARQTASDAAVERANDAAEQVEELVNGNLTPLMEQWLEDNTDKPGGIVSYDKYQSEMVVADGVTLEKSGSTLSVKTGGITDTQIASGALTPAKMNSADAWYMGIVEPQFMTNDEFIEYLNSTD